MVPWLARALALVGTRETVGPASNPVIMEWAAAIGGWVRSFFVNDSIPWCALFADHCLRWAGVRAPGTLAARDFLKWGVPLSQPALGCVAVFARPGGAHVFFYLGETADAIFGVGGNQSDQVSRTWISRGRLLGYRWPSDWRLPVGGPVLLSRSGAPLSKDEA